MTVLVAGVDNLFHGDDGFRCEVLRTLATRALPASVVARDFGIAALDLRFWMERHEAVIVVDVAMRGHAPGTLTVIDPGPELPGARAADDAAHGLTASDVIAWAASRRARGQRPHALRVLGCEPASFGDEDEGALGLSPAVAAAVPRAVELALEIASSLAQEVPRCTSSG